MGRRVRRFVRRVTGSVERAVRGVGSVVGLAESEAQKQAREDAERISREQIEAQNRAEADRKRLDEFNKGIAQQQANAQQTQTQPLEKLPEYDFSSVMFSKDGEDEDELKKILTVKK